MKIKEYLNRIPDEYLNEILGFSEGSGLAYADAAFSAVAANIFGSGFCTNLIVKAGGRLIQGRNFDFLHRFMGEYPVIIEYHPDGKFSFTQYGITGYLGLFDGINEKGLSISQNGGGGAVNRSDNGILNAYKQRMILENCTTLEEADFLLNSYYTDELGIIFTVNSAADNNAAVFDIFSSAVRTAYFNETNPLFAVNIMFSKLRHDDNELTKKFLKLNYGEGQSNTARSEFLYNQLLNNSFEGIDDVISLLRNTDYRGYKNYFGS
jgi:predicted choloylglycine hydrolase